MQIVEIRDSRRIKKINVCNLSLGNYIIEYFLCMHCVVSFLQESCNSDVDRCMT